MKLWLREHGVFVIAIYVVMSLFFMLIRAGQYNQPIDCEVRYLDIVFPLSRLHCPVGGAK